MSKEYAAIVHTKWETKSSQLVGGGSIRTIFSWHKLVGTPPATWIHRNGQIGVAKSTLLLMEMPVASDCKTTWSQTWEQSLKEYPSSRNHGSVRNGCISPIVLTFQIQPFSTEPWLWRKSIPKMLDFDELKRYFFSGEGGGVDDVMDPVKQTPRDGWWLVKAVGVISQK